MRRDYFTCVFLTCICAALGFVCFAPAHYSYNLITPRSFGVAEQVCSWLFFAAVLVVFPLYAAWRKRLWITLGLASYGLMALLPSWMLPGLMDKLSGENAGLGATVEGFFLKAIYTMVNAPFAAISASMGDKFALGLAGKILPVALISYVALQLFRFYRDAYVAEQLDPASAIDKTAKENSDAADPRKVRDARIPEVFGTVISAPASRGKASAQPVKTVQKPAHKPQRPAPGEATVRIPRVGASDVNNGSDKGDTQVIHLGPPQ
ncbi:MAG: hypothetical protein MJ103_00855 [Saccharofermentans sp.]|nr:hypothetical protein [Saccharofermentans sp.]